MRASVVMTSAEAKKLVAWGIYNDPEFQNALKNGIVAIHPSSTTSFLYAYVTGAMPVGYWVSGVIAPHGTCSSKASAEYQIARAKGFNLQNYRFTWVFDHGEPIETNLGEILLRMGPGDVYVKAPNLMDPEGNVGVLASNLDGGTIGKALAARQQRGFSIIAATTGEKLIYAPILEAVRSIGAGKLDKSMGSRCTLVPLKKARVFREKEAIEALTGAVMTPVAGGGLVGCEGGIVMVLTGETEAVEKAFALCESLKGAALEPLEVMDCVRCKRDKCPYEGVGPAWRTK